MNDAEEVRTKRTGNGTVSIAVEHLGGDTTVVEMSEEQAVTAAAGLLGAADPDSILLEAWAVGRDRAIEYGSPEPNMAATADRWNDHLSNAKDADGGLGPVDAALMMIDVKMARLETGEVTRDTLVDIAGYARVAADAAGVNGE